MWLQTGTYIVSAYSNIIDTSSVDFTSSIYSNTPSSTAIIGQIVASNTFPSSVPSGPGSSMVYTSSVSSGCISSSVASSNGPNSAVVIASSTISIGMFTVVYDLFDSFK